MEFVATFKDEARICNVKVELSYIGKIRNHPICIAMEKDGWELIGVRSIRSIKEAIKRSKKRSKKPKEPTNNRMDVLEKALFNVTESFIHTLEEGKFFKGISDEEVKYAINRTSIFFRDFGEVLDLASQIGDD